MNKKLGVLVAGAAAGLILSGAVSARADEKSGGDVYCAGINSCKGQGTCAGAGNSCAGENSCKGKGIIKSTEKECQEKGGKVVPDPMKK
jgi:hypothetical protein